MHTLHLPNAIWIKPNLSIWVRSTRDHEFNTWACGTGCHIGTLMGCRSGPSTVPLLKSIGEASSWERHRKKAAQKPEDRNAEASGLTIPWAVSQIR